MCLTCAAAPLFVSLELCAAALSALSALFVVASSAVFRRMHPFEGNFQAKRLYFKHNFCVRDLNCFENELREARQDSCHSSICRDVFRCFSPQHFHVITNRIAQMHITAQDASSSLKKLQQTITSARKVFRLGRPVEELLSLAYHPSSKPRRLYSPIMQMHVSVSNRRRNPAAVCFDWALRAFFQRHILCVRPRRTCKAGEHMAARFVTSGF